MFKALGLPLNDDEVEKYPSMCERCEKIDSDYFCRLTGEDVSREQERADGCPLKWVTRYDSKTECYMKDTQSIHRIGVFTCSECGANIYRLSYKFKAVCNSCKRKIINPYDYMWP